MSEHIRVEDKDRVRWVTIARPEKKNAITQVRYGAMAHALEGYGADGDLRALVFTGEGDMFTAGNDLMDFAGSMNNHEVPGVIRFLDAIRDCPKPLIAAVNGQAIGIGLTMLLHCDLVYTARSAMIGAPFVKLAVVPEAGSSLLLPKAVGMAVANDILLAGRALSGEEAVAHGLASRLFEDAELIDQVAKIAAGVAASSPTSVLKSKALIRACGYDELKAQMERELKEFGAQLQSADFRESVAAMMQKRAPVYK